MKSSEQINELATAFSLAQGEMENASKSSQNPHFRSKYADLAEVINCIRPVFAKHGLAFTQFVSYESGIVSVETVVMHKGGQWLSGTISAPVSKPDAQGVGSATTYCRRYGLAGIAGLAQEDDDANAAVGGNGKNGKTQNPPQQRSNGAANQNDDIAKTGRSITEKISAAKVPVEVSEIMEAYRHAIDAMPQKYRDELYHRVDARRVELGGEMVDQ